MTFTSRTNRGDETTHTRTLVTTWGQTGDPSLRVLLDALRGVPATHDEGAETVLLDM